MDYNTHVYIMFTYNMMLFDLGDNATRVVVNQCVERLLMSFDVRTHMVLKRVSNFDDTLPREYRKLRKCANVV